MNSLQVFNYQDFTVRTFTDKNGDVWLVAKDVCDVLGIVNARDAVSELDDDEKADVAISDGSQRRHYNVINEAGLYKLTFKSRKPAAKKFTRWVTHDVLPTIRKTGSYSLPNAKSVAAKSDNSLPAHSGSIKAAERILHKVFRCKNTEDFLEVIALDDAFRNTFGHSLLEAQGFKLVKKTVKVKRKCDTNRGFVYWEDDEEVFAWEHNYDLDKIAERNSTRDYWE